MTTDKKEIIIIGGGVIGLACAHYLIDQGAAVTIIEEKQTGSGASHGNCGLLFFSDVITLCAPGVVSTEIIRTLLGTSPLYIKPEADLDRLAFLLRFALNCNKKHMTQAAKDKYTLLSYSGRLFGQLFDKGTLSCDFEDKGLLTAYLSEKAYNGFHRANAFLEQFGFGYQKLSRQETLDFEPALSPSVVGSWFSKHDWHARPDLLVSAWKNDLLRRGLEIKEMCRATGFVHEQGVIRGVQTNRGTLSADAFVLAAGAFCPKIADTLNLSLPIHPGKGYSITMNRPEICPSIPCMLHERNMVVTPWKKRIPFRRHHGIFRFFHLPEPHSVKQIDQGRCRIYENPAGPPHCGRVDRGKTHDLRRHARDRQDVRIQQPGCGHRTWHAGLDLCHGHRQTCQ